MPAELKYFPIDPEHRTLPYPEDIGNLTAPLGTALVPVMGSKVPCGLFGINDDFIDGYQSLDKRFIKNKASTFLFEAEGDSMEPTIFKGDILLVDRSVEHFNTRVCRLQCPSVALVKRVVNQE